MDEEEERGEEIDITKPPASVKVGLDRDELLAEFERMAQEDEGETERQKQEFMECVARLRNHEQLTPGQQADILERMRDNGGENPRAWEYFFQEGCHRSLLVLMNSADFAEDVKRLLEALKIWEIIFGFVGRIPEPREQDMVFRELKREGMVETLLRMMKKHLDDPTLQRKAFYFLHLLLVKEKEAIERKAQKQKRREEGNDEEEEDEPEEEEGELTVKQHMTNEGGIVPLMKNIEAHASYFTEDIIKKVASVRREFEPIEGIKPEDEKMEITKDESPSTTTSAKTETKAPKKQQQQPTASEEHDSSTSSAPPPKKIQKKEVEGSSTPHAGPMKQNKEAGGSGVASSASSTVGLDQGSEREPLLKTAVPIHHRQAFDEAGACCGLCVLF